MRKQQKEIREGKMPVGSLARGLPGGGPEANGFQRRRTDSNGRPTDSNGRPTESQQLVPEAVAAGEGPGRGWQTFLTAW